MESAFTIRNSVTDADEDGQPGGTSCSDDPRIPTPPLDRVPSLNSDHEEETGGRIVRSKHPRYPQGETALTNARSKQLPGSARPITGVKRRSYSDRPPRWTWWSRPPVITANAGEQEPSEPAPDSATNEKSSRMASVCVSHDSIDTGQECDNDVIVVTSAQEEQTHLTPSIRQALEIRHEEASSVQNSPRPSPATEDQESTEPTPLFITLNFRKQTEFRQRHVYRKRLVLILPRAFDLQTQVLEATLPQSPFGNRNAPYHLLLDQWLSLVAIYLTFCRAADFHDTQTAWNAHLLSLSPAERWARDEPHRAASVFLEEWRLRSPSLAVPVWSRDITYVLLEMVR